MSTTASRPARRDWGIVGASLRSASTRATRSAPQDGLYTLAVRGGDGETLRVIGSISRCWSRRKIPAALLDALTDPRIRIVTLTVTEKAYLRNAAGDLDARRIPTSSPISPIPHSPRTAHGFLVEALARRRAAGTRPSRSSPATISRPTARRCIGCCCNSPALRDAAPGALIVEDEVACPVQHGRPHRAGDHRCRPRAHFARRSASRTPGR